MKKLILLVSLLFAYSFAAQADANIAGLCKLTGVKTSPNITFGPFSGEKVVVDNVSFEQCLESARELLAKTFVMDYQVCRPVSRFGQSCRTKQTTVSIRKVKYKFESSEEVIRGAIKRSI